MEVISLGIVEFGEAFSLQEKLATDVHSGYAQETLLLLEHPPVYTIGSSGDLSNMLEPTVPVVRINRGGDVTFHGPGQLVGYPIIDLARRRRDLHRYLRFLEEVLIRLAAGHGVQGFRTSGRTGVWTERGKLASIGVGVRRWVTMHGFALNVAADLAGFSRINPCGMAGCPMTALEVESGAPVLMDDVRAHAGLLFTELLDEWIPPVCGWKR